MIEFRIPVGDAAAFGTGSFVTVAGVLLCAATTSAFGPAGAPHAATARLAMTATAAAKNRRSKRRHNPTRLLPTLVISQHSLPLTTVYRSPLCAFSVQASRLDLEEILLILLLDLLDVPGQALLGEFVEEWP